MGHDIFQSLARAMSVRRTGCFRQASHRRCAGHTGLPSFQQSWKWTEIPQNEVLSSHTILSDSMIFGVRTICSCSKKVENSQLAAVLKDWSLNNMNWLGLSGAAPWSPPFFRIYHPVGLSHTEATTPIQRSTHRGAQDGLLAECEGPRGRVSVRQLGLARAHSSSHRQGKFIREFVPELADMPSATPQIICLVSRTCRLFSSYVFLK